LQNLTELPCQRQGEAIEDLIQFGGLQSRRASNAAQV
jgi:hypothetical protein